jgi:hypothetical protein
MGQPVPNKRAGTLASQQGMDWAPSTSRRGRDWRRWASQYSTGEQSSASLRRRDRRGCASKQTHRPTGGIGYRGPASEEGTRDDGPASAAQSSRHGPACGTRDQRGWVSQSRTSEQVHLPTRGIWYCGPPSEDGTREDRPPSKAQAGRHRPAYEGGASEDGLASEAQASRPSGQPARDHSSASRCCALVGQPVI